MSGPGRSRPVAGFSLPELIISLTLLGLILGGVTSVLVKTQRSFTEQREAARAEDALRVAEVTVNTVMRMAAANPRSITGANRPRIEMNPRTQATFNNVRVISDFNPADAAITGPLEDVLLYVAADTFYVRWQSSGTAAPVAYPVRSLLFVYYNRAGTVITNTAQADSALRVRVTFTAPRHSRTSALTRRDLWIYLRNRR